LSRFGKPNATGRSSGKLSGRAGKLARPPAGKRWAWLTAEMLSSLAWRSLSANGRRLLDFLLLEHCCHAGQETGRSEPSRPSSKALSRNSLLHGGVESTPAPAWRAHIGP
jgi:hypothetical protein